MAMSPLQKLQRSMERAKRSRIKQKQRRQEIQDLKDAGVWKDPRTRYLDKYGYPLPDAPQWWLNLRKAWDANDQRYAARMAARPLTGGEPKQTVRRKKRYKKIDRKPKIKHSEKMRELLADHGIYVDPDNYLCDEFAGWRFCPNGRLQRGSEPTISVHYFLQHYADT